MKSFSPSVPAEFQNAQSSNITPLKPLPSKARLVYLLAASHSGSTLLAMLLGAHADAATAGELKATNLGNPDLYRCSCGERIRTCGFWKRLSTAMQNRGLEYDPISAGTCIHEVPSRYARRLLQPLYRGPVLERVRDAALAVSPSWRRHQARTQDRNVGLVESLLEVTGAKVIIDSSKQALRLKYLLRDPRLEIHVVRCLRDGRAVSLTYTDEWSFADASNPALRNGGTGTKRASVRQNMADAAREWKRSNEAADCLLAGLPRAQWTQVRYEDLCSAPDQTLRRLSEFLGLDPSGVCLNFRAREQHVIGNGMRLDRSSEIRLDERWKTHLSNQDLQVFDQVAGELNRKYGYE